MTRYEAHITYDKQYGKDIKTIADESKDWVYSQITGCPLLGKGDYCYLTGYNPDGLGLLLSMDFLTIKIHRAIGALPLRAKVERIVYDTKTGVNELSNSLPTLKV